MNWKPDICIYHGNCIDGFGAAWAVWRKFGDDVSYFAGVYGKPPVQDDDITGKNVLMVDFTYKRPVIEEMRKIAKSIVILDHHKSAEADLTDYFQIKKDYQGNNGPWFDQRPFAPGLDKPGSVAVLFDMERSGAQITWDILHGSWDESRVVNARRPLLIDYIADRDLWLFKLSGSKEVSSWLFSYRYDFVLWDKLVHEVEADVNSVIDQGEAIQRKLMKDIHELLPELVYRASIGGYKVPVANLPYTMASEAAGIMAENEPFAACYYDRGNGERVYSLRSRGEKAVDVSVVAAKLGGGGHKNASGFQIKLGSLKEIV